MCFVVEHLADNHTWPENFNPQTAVNKNGKYRIVSDPSCHEEADYDYTTLLTYDAWVLAHVSNLPFATAAEIKNLIADPEWDDGADE